MNIKTPKDVLYLHFGYMIAHTEHDIPVNCFKNSKFISVCLSYKTSHAQNGVPRTIKMLNKSRLNDNVHYSICYVFVMVIMVLLQLYDAVVKSFYIQGIPQIKRVLFTIPTYTLSFHFLVFALIKLTLGVRTCGNGHIKQNKDY